MDSDSLNRALDRVRDGLRDWVISGTTEGAERRRSALGKLIRVLFVPTVLILIGGSMFLSKWGGNMGLKKEAPHKLLGSLEETYANSADGVDEEKPAVQLDELDTPPVKPQSEPKKKAAPTPAAEVEDEKVVEAAAAIPTPERPEQKVAVNEEQPAEEKVIQTEPAVPTVVPAAPVSGLAPRDAVRGLVFPAQFAFGKWSPILVSENMAPIENLVKGCTGTVVIEGHSDGLGSPARNDSLARSRATSVSQVMVARGLLREGQPFEVTSLGGTRPIRDDSTEEGRAANRRVEISCR